MVFHAPFHMAKRTSWVENHLNAKHLRYSISWAFQHGKRTSFERKSPSLIHEPFHMAKRTSWVHHLNVNPLHCFMSLSATWQKEHPEYIIWTQIPYVVSWAFPPRGKKNILSTSFERKYPTLFHEPFRHVAKRTSRVHHLNANTLRCFMSLSTWQKEHPEYIIWTQIPYAVSWAFPRGKKNILSTSFERKYPTLFHEPFHVAKRTSWVHHLNANTLRCFMSLSTWQKEHPEYIIWTQIPYAVSWAFPRGKKNILSTSFERKYPTLFHEPFHVAKRTSWVHHLNANTLRCFMSLSTWQKKNILSTSFERKYPTLFHEPFHVAKRTSWVHHLNANTLRCFMSLSTWQKEHPEYIIWTQIPYAVSWAFPRGKKNILSTSFERKYPTLFHEPFHVAKRTSWVHHLNANTLRCFMSLSTWQKEHPEYIIWTQIPYAVSWAFPRGKKNILSTSFERKYPTLFHEPFHVAKRTSWVHHLNANTLRCFMSLSTWQKKEHPEYIIWTQIPYAVSWAFPRGKKNILSTSFERKYPTLFHEPFHVAKRTSWVHHLNANTLRCFMSLSTWQKKNILSTSFERKYPTLFHEPFHVAKRTSWVHHLNANTLRCFMSLSTWQKKNILSTSFERKYPTLFHEPFHVASPRCFPVAIALRIINATRSERSGHPQRDRQQRYASQMIPRLFLIATCLGFTQFHANKQPYR